MSAQRDTTDHRAPQRSSGKVLPFQRRPQREPATIDGVRYDRLATTAPVARCDSCGHAVADPRRFRHETCPPPALPATVAEVLAQLKARRDR